jgi:putative two-component system response regulator
MQQHVVVVDDTEINLRLLETLISRLDHCMCHSFTCPKTALAFCSENRVDLLIVDYMMPEMDGIELIRQLRHLASQTSTPVLMVTANEAKSVRYDALASGADDFITKPVDAVEFLARSRNMLKLSAATRALHERAQWLHQEVQQATLKIRERERDTVMHLAQLAQYRDAETGAHILRMAHYSARIAKQLGFSLEDQELLLDAAAMHDIGKVGIPDALLCKPGKFEPHEFEAMKAHTRLGFDLIKDSQSEILQAGAAVALGHHEKFDGSGYPSGLKGEDIPIFCRIVAVADVFDSLTSKRPYKPAWPLEEAAQYLRDGAGTHFDPRCVEAFLQAWSDILRIRERFADAEDPAAL